MRARLVRMEPGYRGRQRIVIEIAGDFREQFDQLQGALLEVQITRAIPRRSLASNNYFHALVSRIASTVWGEFDEIKSDLMVEYGTPCLDKAGQVVMVDLPEGTDPHSYYPYTRLITTHEKDGSRYCSYILYKRTSAMNSSEMSHLIDGARQEAQELGIDI